MKTDGLLITLALSLYGSALASFLAYKITRKKALNPKKLEIDLSVLPQNSNKEIEKLREEINKLKSTLGKRAPQPTISKDFETPEFQEFFQSIKDNIDPGKLSAIKELMLYIEKRGDCPSVAGGQGDAESRYWRKMKNGQLTLYDLLSHVTLREHTLNVAKELVKLLNETYGTHSFVMMPQALMAAFGHDIGKLPELRTGAYATADHPEISSIAIRKFLLPFSEEEKERIIKAIKQHHSKPKEKLGELLQIADRKAREHEIIKYGEVIAPTLELEDDGTLPPEIIKRLLEEIWSFTNVKKLFKGKTLYHAFTKNKLIYFDPDITSKALRDMGFTNLPEDEKELKLLIDRSFRKYSLVWEKAKEGYYCVPVDIKGRTLYLGALNLEKVAEFIGRLPSDLPQPPDFD